MSRTEVSLLRTGQELMDVSGAPGQSRYLLDASTARVSTHERVPRRLAVQPHAAQKFWEALERSLGRTGQVTYLFGVVQNKGKRVVVSEFLQGVSLGEALEMKQGEEPRFPLLTKVAGIMHRLQAGAGDVTAERGATPGMLLEDFGIAWTRGATRGRALGAGIVTLTHVFPSRVETDEPDSIYKDLVKLHEALSLDESHRPEMALSGDRPIEIWLHSESGKARAETPRGLVIETPAPAPVYLPTSTEKSVGGANRKMWIYASAATLAVMSSVAWFAAGRMTSALVSANSPAARGHAPASLIVPQVAEPPAEAAEVASVDKSRRIAVRGRRIAELPERQEAAAALIEAPPVIASQPALPQAPPAPIRVDAPRNRNAALQALGVNAQAPDQTKRKAALSALTGEQ